MIIHKDTTLKHVHGGTRVFVHQDYPKYKLIKDFVHHILSGCDVHNGLCCCGEVFYQIFMPLRAITSQEANLHGMKIVPGLDLRRS